MAALDLPEAGRSGGSSPLDRPWGEDWGFCEEGGKRVCSTGLKYSAQISLSWPEALLAATTTRMLLQLVLLACICALGRAASDPAPGHGAITKPDVHAGLAHVRIDGKAITEILGPVLNYSFSLSQSALRKGTGYLGANFRLRRAVRDMLSGKRPVKIGIVGE